MCIGAMCAILCNSTHRASLPNLLGDIDREREQMIMVN
jgi:hypothetical protein